MSRWLVLFLVVTAYSCSNEVDQQFCECLKISEELNQVSNAFIDNIRLDSNEIDNIKSLTKEKIESCEPYSNLGGEELIKKSEDCRK